MSRYACLVRQAVDVSIAGRLLHATMESELGRNPGNLRDNEKTFDGIEFAGRSLLDIGAGAGIVSNAPHAWARHAWWRSSRKPPDLTSAQSARSSAGQDALELSQVEARAETLQEFEPAGERFDLLTSMASINHLNEVACIRLNEDKSARTRTRDRCSSPNSLSREHDLDRCPMRPAATSSATSASPIRSPVASNGRNISRRSSGRACWSKPDLRAHKYVLDRLQYAPPAGPAPPATAWPRIS